MRKGEKVRCVTRHQIEKRKREECYQTSMREWGEMRRVTKIEREGGERSSINRPHREKN